MQSNAPETLSGLTTRTAVLCAVLLIMAAVGVRAYRVNNLPGDFQPSRQYNSAMMARAMYWLADPSTPDWKRQVAQGQMGQVLHAEPPVMEMVSAKVYRLLGGEQFWVPRSMSALAWLIGGVFLWLVALRFLTTEAALFSSGFYLLAPFGILMSRNLQPDALMIMGLLASAWATYRYFEAPSALRLMVAGLVAGAAVYLKPGASQFAVLGMFVAMSLHHEGLRWTLADARVWLFCFIAVAPSSVYFLLQIMDGGSLPGILSGNFVPALYSTTYFWRAWAGNLIEVLGLPALVLGAIGLLMVPAGLPRALVGGLAAGYVVQCLFTDLTTAMHEYWHLQALPLAALCLGALSAPVWVALARAVPKRTLNAGAPLLVAVWFVLSLRGAPWIEAEYSGGDLPTIAREIGDAVNHSTKTVFLDYNDGTPTCYFGLYAGRRWPDTQDQMLEWYDGVPKFSADERFSARYAKEEPEFFIISRNFQDFDLQPDLKVFLDRNFPVLVCADRYMIYDLRGARSP
jgi:hypothetical protein